MIFFRFIHRWRYLFVLIGVSALVAVLAAGSGQRTMFVSFLDVGQGDAIYIDMPDHTAVLIDAGLSAALLPELGRVMPWWKHTIDYVIITHPDKDHYGGMRAVAEKYNIGTVYATIGSDDPSYNSLIEYFIGRGIPVQEMRRGDTLRSAHGAVLETLWPPDEPYGTTDNSRSIVNRLSFGAMDFLLTADTGTEEEKRFMAADKDLSAEVLKVGHHGSRYSSDSGFLSQVHAESCIISAGAGNKYGHPHPDVIRRLQEAECGIRATSAEGTITFATDGIRLWQPHFPLSLRLF